MGVKWSLHAEIVRETIMAQEWSAPLRVTLRDGSKRSGLLKHRGRRGFTLDDSIWAIPYTQVDGIATETVKPRPDA